MQSAHCQMRVKNAISAVDGVAVNKIESGIATVSVESDNRLEALVKAIEQAGYPVKGTETTPTFESGEETMKFKTNINCGGCVEKVAAALDAEPGICHWDVDTTSKDRILSVHPEGITKEQVMDAVQKSGFNIEPINT